MARRAKRGTQGSKDSDTKRVNFDNTRVDKFEKDVEGFKDPKCTDKSNDVRWYAHNPEMLRAAASIPFSSVTGLPFPWAEKTGQMKQPVAVPGVMALRWNPTIGGSQTDAVNAAKDSIYSYTVHANSRNTKYNATDEMMVIIAGAQLFAALAAGIRAYGTMRMFDQRNAYLPEALVRAQGFNYNDLKQNLSQMWFDLNEMIARSSQIWIPNNLPFIERWFWLNSNIYMDGTSVKAQYYVFEPNSFYLYDETYNKEGGALVRAGAVTDTAGVYDDWHSLLNVGATWAEYTSMINAMFDALLKSEDRGIIMGDILKAYGAENIYALSPIEAGYRVEPVYDKEVLSQIENASVCPDMQVAFAQSQSTLRLYTVYQEKEDAGDISANYYIPPTQILNFHQIEPPTPEQVMVATRLKAMGTDPTGMEDILGISGIAPRTVGTEYVSEVDVWGLSYNSSSSSFDLMMETLNMVFSTAWSSMPWEEYDWMRWAAFDWAPWVYNIWGNRSTWDDTKPYQFEDCKVLTAYGDYDNWTTVDVATIQKMHTSAVYSEFGVPTI